MLLKATGPEFYVATTATAFTNNYDSLEETLNHLKCLKIKDHTGENVAECFASILGYAKIIDSAGSSKPDNLAYITHIFENNYDPRFHLWETHKNKDVTEFITENNICDKDVMRPEELITYGSLVQEDMGENPLISKKSLKMTLCL